MKPVGFRLQVAYWQKAAPDNKYPDAFDSAQSRVLPRPTLAEDFDDLSWDPASPDYYVKRLQDNSALVRLVKGSAPVTKAEEVPVTAPAAMKIPAGGGGGGAGGGAAATDPKPGLDDFKGVLDPPDERTGIAALSWMTIARLRSSPRPE